jgi:polysaccharide biosynthesis transport protein
MNKLIRKDPDPQIEIHALPRRIEAEALPLTFDLRQIWMILAKHRWKILIMILLAVAASGVLSYTATPQYRSLVSIQIDPEAAKVVPYFDISEAFVNANTNYELYMKTKDEVLRSPALARRTVKQVRETLGDAITQEQEDDLSNFPRNLGVQRIEGSQIVRLSFSSADPEFAAKVANTVAEEFIKMHFEGKYEMIGRAKDFLNEQLETIKTNLEKAELELVEYAGRHGFAALDRAEDSVAQQGYSYLTTERVKVEGVYIAKSAELEALQQASPDNFPEQLRNNSISSLEDQALRLEQEISLMRTQFGGNWPDLQKKQQDLDLVRTQLRREREGAIAAAREQVQMDYAVARRQYEMLSASLQEHRQLIEEMNEASIRFNILKRDVDTNQTLYQSLLQRLKETGVVAGLDFGNIHIVDPATPPLLPYSPQPLWNLLLAILFGSVIGLSTALLLEYVDNSIEMPEELDSLGLPSLGYIPKFKPIENGHRVFEPGSLLELETGDLRSNVPTLFGDARPARVREAYRSLFASVLMSKGSAPPQTLMVTSAVPREGKSTTVINLGVTLAQNGARTLLIDLDLRKPSLASAFDADNDFGASLFLSGNSAVVPDIQETKQKNLYVIPAGPRPPNPLALLTSAKLGQMLSVLRKDFTYILVDSPPVLNVSDAWVIAPFVDGVLMVVRFGHTPRDLVRRATSRLVDSGATVLGAMINSADLDNPGYTQYEQYYGDSSYYG